MIDTKSYRTKTLFQSCNNVKTSEKFWNIGLDIGYSAVKVFSGNSIACFPAYALIDNGFDREINIEGVSDLNETIKYRDEDGIIWTVGAAAQDRIDPADTSAGSSEIYIRNRYESPMFKVITRVGLAAGMRNNQYGSAANKKVKVVTGLPPKYVKSDTAKIIEAMAKKHHFDVKFGRNEWEHFDISLSPEDIHVISQPEGTLYSLSADKELNLTKDAIQYFNKKVLIMDSGFGTLDMFPFEKGRVNLSMCQTYQRLGMKAVIEDTVNEINDLYQTEISVPAFQQNLVTGKVRGKIGAGYSNIEINNLLEKHSKDICYQALEKIIVAYDPAATYDFFVVTGGTCAAWKHYIREYKYFIDNPILQIVDGNQGDPELPYIFSNVRGYYIEASASSSAAE